MDKRINRKDGSRRNEEARGAEVDRFKQGLIPKFSGINPDCRGNIIIKGLLKLVKFIIQH
jgi:hypothetical protein